MPPALAASLPRAEPPRAAAVPPGVPTPAASATAGAAPLAPWRRDHWDLCDVGRLPLAPGRKAYVHLVRGALGINGQGLSGGDAAKLEAESEVRLEAGRDAEVLVFDLPA